MSDSAQNVEIEDVLSSIRRLVSGDDWSRQAPADPVPAENTPEPASAAEKPPEKFVLTPVLRVVDTEVEDGDAEPDPAAFSDSENAPEPAPEFVASAEALAPTDTSFDEIDEPASQSWEEVDPQPADDTSSQDVVLGDAGADDLSTLIDVDAPSADTIPAGSPRDALEATIAELEAAVADQPQDWEPDGSEVDPADTLAWVAPPSRRAVPADAVEDAQTVGPEEEVTFHHVGPDFVATEQLDELADLSNGSDATGSYGSEMDENLNAYLENDGVIDEQMLRDLVAEIVRQELQGNLGERITRNVRKLVRREIYRVLASQEFE